MDIRPAPPLTRVEDVVEVLHGVRVHDPYRWLEDESAPEVADWVARQQGYARAYLDALPERPAIEARLREALDVGALGPSRPRGRYRFFLRPHMVEGWELVCYAVPVDRLISADA